MSTAEDAHALGRVTIADLTEEDLLAAFAPLLPPSRNELVGTGDDCAVLVAPDSRYCVSTDILVQGRHFSTDWSSAWEIGARAAAQNLADVAAMGARPVAIVVGLVLPATTTLAWVKDLTRGMAEICAQNGAGIVGGDLSAGENLVIAVTVHGDLEGRSPVLRSGARAGDLLIHAGTLGRSAAGLALLSNGIDDPDRAGSRVVSSSWEGFDEVMRAAVRESLSVFRAPAPPLKAGPALAEAGATAMMDVSDGLLRDAGRMAAASEVRIDLEDPASSRSGAGEDLAVLEPVAGLMEDSRIAARALARRWVLTGGEDHGMLAAFPTEAATGLPMGCRVIGRVLEQNEGPRVTVGGRAPDTSDTGQGWDHFRG